MAKSLPIVKSFEGHLPGSGSCLPWCIMEDPIWDWVEFLTYPVLVWSTMGMAFLGPWTEVAQYIQQVNNGELRYPIEMRWDGFVNGLGLVFYDPLKVIASLFIELYNGAILFGIAFGYTFWAGWEEFVYLLQGLLWVLDLGYQISNTFILHFDHVADWFNQKSGITIWFLIFFPFYVVWYYPYLLMDWWW